MAWLDFLWTDEALEKIARHHVTPEEVEYVTQNPQSVVNSESSDRLVARGYTLEGRWITCVYEEIDRITVMPITAYQPTPGGN